MSRSKSSNDQQFEILCKKLDALIRVTGMAACRGLPNDDQAWLLHCAGLSSPEIAELLDSTDIAIRQAIHRMKTRRKTARVKKGGRRGPDVREAGKKAK